MGKAAAHDEVTHFTIEEGELLVNGESSVFKGTLTVEFAKVLAVHTVYQYSEASDKRTKDTKGHTSLGSDPLLGMSVSVMNINSGQWQ